MENNPINVSLGTTLQHAQNMHKVHVLEVPASNRATLEYLEYDFNNHFNGTKVERILATHSTAQRWFVANNIENPFMVISHDFDKSNEALQLEFESFVRNGVWLKFDNNTEAHYTCVFGSPSNIRSAYSIFMLDDIIKVYCDWAVAYTDVSKLPSVKQAQAWTLMLSTTTTWSKMFPHIPVPAFENAYIGENFEHEEMTECFCADAAENIVKTIRKIVNDLTDGQSYIVVNDIGLDEEQRTILMSEMKGCSLRFPGVKVSAQFILASTLVKIMEDNNVEYFEDGYGRRFDKNHLPSIIMFYSGFKLSKVIKTREQMDLFVNNCKLLNHEFAVCITEHNPTRDMPAQVLQCMEIDFTTAKNIAKKTYETVKPYFGPKSHMLIGGSYGEAARLFPPLRGDCLYNDTWEAAISNWCHRLIGGRVAKAVRYHIVSQDPYPIIKHILHINGKTMIGMIPEDHCICQFYKTGTELGTYRMPNNDNNLSILVNIDPPERYSGLYIGNSCFVSAHGYEMLLKQMDFDGDKIGIFTDPEFIDLAKKCIEKQDRKPLALRALSKPEPKESYDINDWQNFVISLISAPVGLCANAATMTWSFLPQGTKRTQLYYLASELCTLVIDRAKNPDDKGAATNAEELIRSISPTLGHEMYDRGGALKNLKMPRFNAYAKSSWNDPIELQTKIQNTKFAANSGLDWYSGFLRLYLYGREGANESNVKLEQPVVWNNFNTSKGIARMFCKDGKRVRVAGLGEFFDGLIKTVAAEYKAAMQKSLNQREAMTAWTNKYVYDKCMEFVSKQHPNHTQCELENKLVSGLFTIVYAEKSNDWRSNSAKRVLWQVFGKIAVNILQENINNDLWNTIIEDELSRKDAVIDMPEIIDEQIIDKDDVINNEWYEDDSEGGEFTI